MTSSTLTRLAPTQVSLEIPVGGEELAAAEERAFRRLAKDVRLPGFRRGKAPRKVFEQAYGAERLTSMAIDEVIPALYAQAVREHDLQPVESPQVEVLEESNGRPTRLKAVVEVRPPIELGRYKGVPVAAPDVEVAEEDVDRAIASLARERATAVPVDRAAELGDMVTLDYEGTIEGEPFDGGRAAGEVVELREGRFVPGFAEGIAGMRAGERKEIAVRFPDDYPAQNLAGKEARFDIALHEVKTLELPAIDDAFAQSLTAGSADELRADVRRRLEALARARSRRAASGAILQNLLAAHDFPLPAGLVERELDALVNDAAAAAAGSGTTFDEYLKARGTDEAALRSEHRQEAESRVKGTLLIEAIAKAEKIVATPADVAAELDALARQYGQPTNRIREALGGNVAALMEGIVRNKTLEFLIDNAATGESEETRTEVS